MLFFSLHLKMGAISMSTKSTEFIAFPGNQTLQKKESSLVVLQNCLQNLQSFFLCKKEYDKNFFYQICNNVIV